MSGVLNTTVQFIIPCLITIYLYGHMFWILRKKMASVGPEDDKVYNLYILVWQGIVV